MCLVPMLWEIFLAHLFSCLSPHPVCIKGALYCWFYASLVRWFISVSYVFSTWSYILGNCSGWLPMHFDEMDHLPYRHAQCMPSISMEVLQISIFDWVFWGFSCFSGSLHDLSLFLSSGTFYAISFWSSIFPMCFSLFLHFIDIFLYWVPDQALLPGPISLLS